MYMGSRGGDELDAVLKQNHEMLVCVHEGRSAHGSPMLFPFLVEIFHFFLIPSLVCRVWDDSSIGEAEASHVYSYKHGFRGFAARLTEEQASSLSSKLVSYI